VRGRGIRTTFVITGWNDDSLSPGQSVFFDKTIRVVASQASEGRMFVRAERLPSDEDAILDDFREFRKPDEGNLSDR
jgi:hypothetical protein